MAQATPQAGPVVESARVTGLDAARGFALLGIFLVNIQMFGDTLGSYIRNEPAPGESGADLVAYYAVKTLCDAKFYPLFSLLFGAGMALQRERVRAIGRRFAPLYLRRLGLLALIGACHAIFLWYGDVLFIYAGAGLLLLALSGLRARTQAIISISVIVVATLLMGLFTAVGEAMNAAAERERTRAVQVDGSTAPQAASEAGEAAATRRDALEMLGDAGDRAFDPTSPERDEAETVAFRDGPYAHAVAFRAINWGTFMIVVVAGFGWHVLAMFLLGSALVKWGVFEPGRERTLARIARVGLLVGLPLAAALALAPMFLGSVGDVVQASLVMTVGPLVSLGYLSGAVLLARRAPKNPIVRALSGAGRVALTVYLLESVCAQFVFQHWGLAQFGEFSRVERIALVFGVYLALVVFANLWLRAFRIGPMEWLWRTGTYLRLQPLLRPTARGGGAD